MIFVWQGLVEAMDKVVPRAEVRFCVRHIWANFKLKFNGTVFKELFWSATRATTYVSFHFSMFQCSMCASLFEFDLF